MNSTVMPGACYLWKDDEITAVADKTEGNSFGLLVRVLIKIILPLKILTFSSMFMTLFLYVK